MRSKENNLYDIFKNYSYKDILRLFENAKTKEEQDFYVNLSNMILQREQKKVIDN
ncbi:MULTISPECIES: hypothetical protein [Clostridium]|uniref:Uncharacterized protein n=1 Tax=Clostridium botulinum TaxID=1491 RepID=A0A9Q1ZC79_CLOBO|nr:MULTISPECIES: hypothetical protein [Clostridium]AEB76014.1 conserved hypothetical protein [Clostridium botulinum BKT015925]KLU76538.1 hypothetical protein CBC3_03075 [Clostridium botulinum V891]KOA72821.1 hypothetical protein ADU78_14125 [Clostridium botulinum]KOA73931.1 hypothetical protein ADU77_13075 [Clostridium botulinum]KOA83542.1 hypothetical protein ADU80_11690 [Clostridium botulinum]